MIMPAPQCKLGIRTNLSNVADGVAQKADHLAMPVDHERRAVWLRQGMMLPSTWRILFRRTSSAAFLFYNL
jgi:hypothetical protein